MPYNPEGDPKTAKIIFVGEAPAAEEMRLGKPFIGPAGNIFNRCLDYAGIVRSDCYITNVFDYRVRKERGKSDIFNQHGQKVFSDTKEGFTELGKASVHRLEEELKDAKSHIIVPMGAPAYRAICGGRGITKWRGSVVKASMKSLLGKKCVPTIHPASVLHGQYLNIYLIRSDFKKANREAEFPEIRRPLYDFITSPTYSQCMEALEHLEAVDRYGCDIEVGFFCSTADPMAQVTRISFAETDLKAISIPYGDANWSLEQELNLWLATAKLLEKPGPAKIFHNAAFDIQILFFIHGVLVAPPYHDTMIGHHIVYPDFKKSLAMCASIHTNQPYWKDMVKHGSIENPEG